MVIMYCRTKCTEMQPISAVSKQKQIHSESCCIQDLVLLCQLFTRPILP